ncbi:putative 2-carboxy-D-arabinitol-1-phosphatase [Nymphaea thermarum]|nr:putative 2-carboxy-D-arabinitol-1-phosphatase [Nymphaea thermarum]
MGGGLLVQFGTADFRWWVSDIARQVPYCVHKHQRWRFSSPPPSTQITCHALRASSPASSSVATKATSRDGAVDVLVSQEPKEDVRAAEAVEKRASLTGNAYDFKGATTSLVSGRLTNSKKVTIVRHGLSSWNAESRIQGSSNLSILTDAGEKQAEMCRHALSNLSFDCCFSSPISRAKRSAELIWQEREEPLIFLDSLKEANLYFLEGMKNVDAKREYPELYNAWREDPVNFKVNGIYPVRDLWLTAKEAWKEILVTPGESFLVVTHKSILRALICTALGLAPERFRALDINNGGISTIVFNKQGEAMLQSLNLTSHIYSEHVYY